MSRLKPTTSAARMAARRRWARSSTMWCCLQRTQCARLYWRLVEKSIGPDFRDGSFATGSSRQQVRSCPLCPESGSEFGALAALRRAVAGCGRDSSARTGASNHALPWRGRNGEGEYLAFRLTDTASLEVHPGTRLRTKPRPSGYRSLQIATGKFVGYERYERQVEFASGGARPRSAKHPLDMQPFGCLLSRPWMRSSKRWPMLRDGRSWTGFTTKTDRP